MKIELYEPYHIGIKLANFVNLNTLKIQLIDALKGKKYDLSEEKITIAFPIEKIKENIAFKKKLRIELFYPVNAVNAIINLTNNPKNAIDAFNDIIDILEKSGYNLEKSIRFFEIVTNLTIKTERDPIQIFNKITKVDLGTFEDLGKINISGFKFRSEKNENEFLELIFEPRLVSPEDKYFLRVIYRTRQIENVKKFHEELENNILKNLKLIEGD